VRVRDLIELLKQQDQDAVVMTWEQMGRISFVTELQSDDVVPVQLCKFDNDGVWTTDIYKSQYCESEPFPGIIIGRNI